MRDDRAVTAFERCIWRPLAVATAALVVGVCVFAIGFALIVDSSTEVGFPAVVTVATPPAARSSVPVNFRVAVIATTPRAPVTRGGHAATTAAPDTVGLVARGRAQMSRVHRP